MRRRHVRQVPDGQARLDPEPASALVAETETAAGEQAGVGAEAAVDVEAAGATALGPEAEPEATEAVATQAVASEAAVTEPVVTEPVVEPAPAPPEGAGPEAQSEAETDPEPRVAEAEAGTESESVTPEVAAQAADAPAQPSPREPAHGPESVQAPPARLEPAPESESVFAPTLVLPLLPPEPEPEPADPPLDGRPMSLRLARLHLRMGALAQARAELEALAGRGALDEDALVDLAEVRWRTGDLPGAGEAADAAISKGRRDGVALVIAAEAMAAIGRPSEARRLAARALGAIEAPLDPIFAGMPRNTIWPGDEMLDAGPSDAAVDRARAVAGGAAVAASAAAAEAFAGGRAAMNRGDSTTAAVRLGIALRLDPGFARGVLDVVEDRTEAPLLALVAGDALRLLGREDEALEAYHQARGRVAMSTGPRRDEDDPSA